MVLFSLLFRIVLNTQSLLLVMHVRHTLHLSYAAAGLLSTVVYLCMAGTELRRGPRLDRSGLRPTMARAILINGVCWVIAPFAPFPLLLLLAALAGWSEIPVINVAKQAITVATTERERRPALAAYEVTADVSLLVGPPLGVAAINIWDTDVVLFVARLVAVGCGFALLSLNPPLRTEASQAARRIPRRSWLQPGFVAACVGYAAAAAVLCAQELIVITAMHDFHAKHAIGLVLAVGAAGAVAGGYGYGAISRTISPYVLLVGLGISMLPCAFASGPVSLAIAVFIVGVLGGAVFPASTDRMNDIVSKDALGEALGFHFSLMWVGVAMGSIVASQAVNFAGSSGGILSAAAIGIGAGIGLGRIAARAAPMPGVQVSRALIVTASRRMLDIAQIALVRNTDGSLDIWLGGKNTPEKKAKSSVLGQPNQAEFPVVSSMDSEAVGPGQTGVRRLRTPWTEAPPPRERKGSPWSRPSG
ncbi:MFS transporter [Nocardia amamiensis]|uniref:MFS transporter n=1 Tax=Nocardia amamiensis TaxID=404578 RepID=A0ABS0CWS6_9NOCA|nr:MFS transporter [Nocardia amamiensis]MBF6301039.1 MFS transporter [Nocardia amamiensis]